MIGLVIQWEMPFAVAVNSKATSKYFKIWTHTAKAFGVEKLYIVDAEDNCPQNNDSEIKCEYFGSLEDALEACPSDIPKIFVKEGGENIYGYSHPRDAIYVIGSDYGTFNIPDGYEDDEVVGFNSKIPLHAFVAAGIVLSSR